MKGNQGLTLTMGLLGALAAGIAGAFGIEAMRATVHSRRDGELRLGLPILGVLPERA
jgi:capsular polysaccharide biosynthesis protein